MTEFGADDLERIVAAEIASQAETPAPATAGARLRSIDHYARHSGTSAIRTMSWLEHKARRLLHEIRKRRAG